MNKKKRLFLIDAYALIFRGYYAFIKNPRINSKGLDTSAILGFTNSLFDVIKRESPDYLAVCFDKGGSQDRIKIFDQYKANRDETPEAIKISVPIIEEILKSLNISVLVKEGFEADDIIGTIAKKVKSENFETYIECRCQRWIAEIKRFQCILRGHSFDFFQTIPLYFIW